MKTLKFIKERTHPKGIYMSEHRIVQIQENMYRVFICARGLQKYFTGLRKIIYITIRKTKPKDPSNWLKIRKLYSSIRVGTAHNDTYESLDEYCSKHNLQGTLWIKVETE